MKALSASVLLPLLLVREAEAAVAGDVAGVDLERLAVGAIAPAAVAGEELLVAAAVGVARAGDVVGIFAGGGGAGGGPAGVAGAVALIVFEHDLVVMVGRLLGRDRRPATAVGAVFPRADCRRRARALLDYGRPGDRDRCLDGDAACSATGAARVARRAAARSSTTARAARPLISATGGGAFSATGRGRFFGGGDVSGRRRAAGVRRRAARRTRIAPNTSTPAASRRRG